MRQRRDLIILLALFAALVAFTILGPGRTRDEELRSTPTTHSSAPGGALALLRWFDALGYNARRLEFTEFAVDERTAALFILNPSEPINRTQASLILDWVAAGGTLVIADDRPRLFGGGNALLSELEIAVVPAETSIERAAVVQPALTTPPLREALVRTDRVLEFSRDDVAPLVAHAEGVIVAGIRQGQGYIYVSSAIHPFTNAGLEDEQNAALALNLLRRVPPGGQILFDEYHHGFFEPPSLRSVVLSSPWGWGLIYALAVVAGYLILTGRRFGRPIPLREETVRRSSAEYVEHMADLFQRGGKRQFILQHYHAAFKRRLARPYGINPRIDDREFVAELARYRPVDQAALNDLLTRLRRANVGEDEMVRLVAELDATVVKRDANA